jgi:pSer/pThr/pTyr-binding forkhead associated (FHA) protein
MFSDRQVIVGRDPTVADLVLESSQVSRRHAILEQNGSTVLIRDAGSTNGIYLRNRRIDETELTRLDEVLLGDFSLKVKLVNKGKPEGASVAPTRVANARDFVDADEPSVRRERVDSDRATRAEPPRGRNGSGGRRSEVSDWDDLEQEFGERQSAPRAEFRDSDEVMDQGRFGEMLGEMGIARDDEGTHAEARPRKAKPLRERPKKKKRRPQPEPRDSWEEEELETGVDESDLDEESIDDFDREPVVWEEDEDDEDANYVPPYSLVAQLLREDNVVNRGRHGTPQVEVLTLQGDSVAGAHLLQPGESFWVGPEIGAFRRRRARDLPARVRLLKYRRGGDCQVEMHREASGTLKRGQKRIKLDSVDGVKKNARRGTTMMGFKNGEILDIVDGGNRYHIRYVSAPPAIRDHRGLLERVQPDKWLMRSFGGSAGAHIAALILVYLLVPPDVVHSTLRKNDEFVEVTMEATPEIEEEKPPEEPEEPEEEPQQVENERVPPKQNRTRRRVRTGGTAKAPAGVLGLLSKKGSSRAPGPAAAVAAVSNLTAAKVPGASAGYRVSGLIGKLPANSLSVGGGGGGLMTKGGAALLRGGGGGGGLARGKSRGVGALVQKNPKAMRSVGQGHLDRDEIQKVINKNIGHIQRCYERELIKTPGLSGKVQVEWTIATSGRVRTARQTFTSIRSTNVSNCILGAIRGWVFPRPRGGEVVVNYPFIFKSIGF